MKKVYVIVFVIVATALILTACMVVGTSNNQNQQNEDDGVQNQTYQTYEACLTGVTMKDVPVTNSEHTHYYYSDAYVIIPNEGCNLPKMYCSYVGNGSGVGSSCVVIP